MKAQKVYTDSAGNTLWKRYIKTRGIWQFSAKNSRGQLATGAAVNTLMKRAGMGQVKKMRGTGKIKKGKYTKK